MDDVRPLMEVANAAEGERICEVLRAAGIKCNHALVPGVNRDLAALTLGDDQVEVFVGESDLDQARAVIAEYQSGEARS